MEIGSLKDRIEIELLSTFVNKNTGELTQSWSTYGSFWAKKETAGGSEGERKDVVTQKQRINFIIRYNATIDTNTKNFRIVYNNNTLDIESAEEVTDSADSVRMWLKLKCVYRSNSQ